MVRLWRDGDGLKIRFLVSQTGQRPSTLTLATSVESAIRQFEQWLRSTESGDEGLDDGTDPASPPTTPLERRGRRNDDGAATGAKTARSYRHRTVKDDATRDDLRREPS